MTCRTLPFTLTAAFAALSAVAIALAATPARAADDCARVEVQNVRPEQGLVMVAAYIDAASFSKAPATAVQMRAGTATTMSVPLCGLAGPTVAITLYQDLNGNGKLDVNPFGVPTEPWGASGKPAAMAAPTWDATAVALDGAPIVVRLSK